MNGTARDYGWFVGGQRFGEDGFETISKDFCDDFVGHILKAYSYEVMQKKKVPSCLGTKP